MTKKDIVKAAVEFKKPPEIPVLMWMDGLRLEMFSRTHRQKVWNFIKDRHAEHIRQLCPDLEELQCCTLDWPESDTEWRDQIAGWKFGSVWPVGGFVFRKLRPVYSPLEREFDAEKLELPDPDDPLYLSKAEKTIKQNEDKYLIGYVWFTVFEKMHLTAGFENILLGPRKYRDSFLRLRDKIMDFNIRATRRWLSLGVDAIFTSDDWGTQDSLIIPPDMWREYYKPCYKEIIDETHKGKAHAWFHSCGHVFPIIGDLIEIGLDVLHPIQPHANNLEDIAEQYGGKICFSGGIDIQETMPHGTTRDVEEEIFHAFDLFGAEYGGGIIPGPGNTILEDAPFENIRAIYDAVDKLKSRLPWN
jgi:uroporphyrinogen-III decarboxylase